MVIAGGIKTGAFGQKPRDLADLVRVLTRGAAGAPKDRDAANASDSEYIDDWTWGNEANESDQEQVTDGRRGEHS